MELTKIYLARHGQTEYNRRNQIQGRGIDASLNDRGRRQARAIADYFTNIDIHKIYSSSLKRSVETAQTVAEAKGVKVQSYPDLDEMDFGIFEGRPLSEIESELTDLHNMWKSGDVHYPCRNGESPQTVLDRAATQIDNIVTKHSGDNLLFVLHGRLIRILVSHWLKYGLSQMHRIPHKNGALYHLHWDGELFEPIFLNQTEHLTNGLES